MLRGDDDNFLKLAAALKIILGRSICITELPRAKMLLESYLGTFYKVLYKNLAHSQLTTRLLPYSSIP
jgi:hypothetical protein